MRCDIHLLLLRVPEGKGPHSITLGGPPIYGLSLVDDGDDEKRTQKRGGAWDETAGGVRQVHIDIPSLAYRSFPGAERTSTIFRPRLGSV